MAPPPNLIPLCERHYGPRWKALLAADIATLSGEPIKPVLRTVQRWAAGHTAPPPVALAFIRLLTNGQ